MKILRAVENTCETKHSRQSNWIRAARKRGNRSLSLQVLLARGCQANLLRCLFRPRVVLALLLLLFLLFLLLLLLLPAAERAAGAEQNNKTLSGAPRAWVRCLHGHGRIGASAQANVQRTFRLPIDDVEWVFHGQ